MRIRKHLERKPQTITVYEGVKSTGTTHGEINVTQLPYAVTVAAVSFVTYLIAGFVKNAIICLPIGIVLMVGTLVMIQKITAEK